MSEARLNLVLPAVGGAGTGEISEWYQESGQHVTGGEPVVAVDIDKAVVDVPAPVDGVLTAVAEVGAEVRVGDVLGWIQPERGD